MILVEHGPDGRPAAFLHPREVIRAERIADVRHALARAEAARKAGAWVAGYLSYEAGYAFEERLYGEGNRGGAPLLQLGLYDTPHDALPILEQAKGEAGAAMSAPAPMISRADYQDQITRVLNYIAAGDCYQVNLTFPMRAQLQAGHALGLYAALRASAAAGHGAYVDFGDGCQLVSLSPELFFRLDATGGIEARPMKGTRPRDADPIRDLALAEGLAADPKDRAENLMIVDLLRNDIARISRPGSVKVPKLFAVESYPSVHQMTSTVTGQLSAPPELPALMAALFPCGSVTGAPKIRAMQIIREVEPYPRGVYCGAIGWMAPDGRADFSVAIRTLSVKGDRILMNVGGGIVQDSTPDGEWEEALWKARFTKAAVIRG